MPTPGLPEPPDHPHPWGVLLRFAITVILGLVAWYISGDPGLGVNVSILVLAFMQGETFDRDRRA